MLPSVTSTPWLIVVTFPPGVFSAVKTTASRSVLIPHTVAGCNGYHNPRSVRKKKRAPAATPRLLFYLGRCW